MLSAEENELITKVGPGTPMGELARRFWTPVLLAEELPAPDCDPVRARILGEDLVAFKDSKGRIGVLEPWCAHRGADLFYGRNEEEGLRCVYHGWKYDVEGTCVDVPNAPEGATFKEKIRARAYPAVERGGVVWAYLGPRGNGVPEFPEMEWTRVPDDQRYISKMFLECNYLQTMEADIDSSHLGFLHSYVTSGTVIDGRANGIQDLTAADKAPVWTVTDTEYGVMLTARRDAGENYYWRINQWMLPFYTMIAARPGDSVLCQVKVPVDDQHAVAFRVRWHAERPLTPEELSVYRDKGILFPEMVPGTFRTKENRSNDYLLDRAAQRHYSFTGIKSIPAQDFAVTEVQHGGPVSDRTREHLVSSDTAIIQVRRRLMRSVRQLMEGQEPPEARNGGAFRVRSAGHRAPEGGRHRGRRPGVHGLEGVGRQGEALANVAHGYAVAVAPLLLALVLLTSCTSPGHGFDPEVVSKGQELFAANCATCHGAGGEGAADWHIAKTDGTLPPPPLNGDGHTWHHGDGLLYHIVRNGGQEFEDPRFGNFKSAMPAFGERLSHDEIVAVLTYVKSLWGDKTSRGVSIVESQARASEDDPFPLRGGLQSPP